MSSSATESGTNGAPVEGAPVEPATVESTPAPTPEPSDESFDYTASILPGRDGDSIPVDFAEAVLALEEELGQRLWLLSWGFKEPYPDIDEIVRRGFFDERKELRACEQGAALLIDSPGGVARSAYQIATLFRRHCGGFTAVVPRAAKSAATLIVLGADRILLGHDAELGPLDVQLWDSEREVYTSALDEVQALERLNSVALDFVDQAMFLLVDRTGRKTVEILPLVLDFAAKFMHPLLDKIDTVHYNERARVLKVAEEYALRLLRPNYPREHRRDQAAEIAGNFVNAYPEHGFVIDRDELRGLLDKTLVDADAEIQPKIDRLEEILTENPITAVGRVERRATA